MRLIFLTDDFPPHALPETRQNVLGQQLKATTLVSDADGPSAAYQPAVL